MNRQQLLTVV